MSPERQSMAIAEKCGIFDRPLGQIVEYRRWSPPNGVFERVRFEDGSVRPCYRENLPDYLHDLNAMHEAIREVIAGKRELEVRFIKELHAIQDGLADSEDVTPICEHEMVDIISECSWLAEAFLRTIGKWEAR